MTCIWPICNKNIFFISVPKFPTYRNIMTSKSFFSKRSKSHTWVLLNFKSLSFLLPTGIKMSSWKPCVPRMGTNKTFFSAIDVLAGSHESRVNNSFLLITMLIKILELLTFFNSCGGGCSPGVTTCLCRGKWTCLFNINTVFILLILFFRIHFKTKTYVQNRHKNHCHSFW